MYYDRDDIDLDTPPRRLAGRCAECWTSFGHAAGCPNDDTDDRDDAAGETQH